MKQNQTHQETTRHVIYDIPKENIIEFNIQTDELTNKDLKNNRILMTWAQASAIRKAKGLPMPCPLVDVEIRE